MARPINQMPYQPVGELRVHFPGHDAASDYRRELDLDTAIASVVYAAGGVRFTREVFSSPVDQVIVVNLTADRRGQLTFSATLSTPQKAAVEAGSAGELILRGQNGDANGIKGALKFEVRVRVLTVGGNTATEDGRIVVNQADRAMLLVAAATSYTNYKDVGGDPQAVTKSHLAKAADKRFEQMRAAHVREHRRLFRRVRLDLGTTEAASLPTDERLAKFAEGSDDPQPGGAVLPVRPLPADRRARRPGTQPANLQGIWNESIGAALGVQVHRQHQHRDELLAGRADQSGRVPSSRCSTWSRIWP